MLTEDSTTLASAARDTVLRFEEGLIGFSDCKDFVLMENSELAPLRRLQCTERPEVAFFVLDPSVVMENYPALIPLREWESMEIQDPGDGITLAICAIKALLSECTVNLQAPLLVNYKRMIGKQIILTEPQLTSKQPLV